MTPQTPVPESSHTALKAVVIILGVLLIVGFIVIITTIALRVANLDEAEPTASPETITPPPLPVDIALPQGAKIVRFDTDAGRLAVHINYANAPEKEEILIFDLATGRQLAKIRTQAARP